MLRVEASWIAPAIRTRIEKDNIKDFFRVKTIRLRGELSQGLIISIPEDFDDDQGESIENALSGVASLPVGTDVTEMLQIQKYEPPMWSGRYSQFRGGKPAGNFPTHLVTKTDELRIQSNPKLLPLLQGRPYYTTVKMDGTSGTYVLHPETSQLLVCSRNLIRKRPSDLTTCPYWTVAEKYKLQSLLEGVPYLAIQGEICGPNIQKNLLSLKEVQFFVFNIVDIRDRHRLSYPEMKQVCSDLELPMVPLEASGESFPPITIKELLQSTKGFYAKTKHHREGLVIRSMDSTISFKAINNDYLLSYEI